jgi:2-phosphosulfolactate phosphatase
MLKINVVSSDTSETVTGLVVVIDVLRAFTTAAYALAAGATEIIPVRTVAEAVALRQRLPDALIAGEVLGTRVPAFDLGNSPSEVLRTPLAGKRLIQRTSGGTQGLVRAAGATTVLAGSFVCAGATLRYLQRLQPAEVTFVITGAYPGWDGDEDRACAEYLSAGLHGRRADAGPFLARVRASVPGRLFADAAHPEYPAEDLHCCLALDRFDFALRVERQDTGLSMRAVRSALGPTNY